MPDFYLLCFLLGFGLSVITLLAGSVDLHLPHLHFDGGFDAPHADITGLGDGGAANGGGHAHAHAHGHARAGVSWFNLGTAAAFLAWFGGTGYLLTHVYKVWFLAVLAISTVSGFIGSSLVFLFLTKFLMNKEEPLNPLDYDMVGVLGKLSIPIREGGTGELVYSQEGTRHVTGACSEDGRAIPRDAEVIVTRYEKGIAYVRPWEDPLGDFDRK
jgi:hypothetical protein